MRTVRNGVCLVGNVALLAQLLVNGLAMGAVYALMASGFAIVYNATRIFHLAHGAVLTLSAYGFYVFLVLAKIPFPLAVLATILISAIFGGLIEIGVYAVIRRRGGGPASQMLASLGLLVLLQNILAIVFSTDVLTVRSGSLTVYQVGPITITSYHIAVGIVVVLMFGLLQGFLNFSRYGRAIRALADNPNLALAIGIDTKRTYVLIMALGSVMASIAAMLLTWDVGVEPEMGFMVIFFAIVAVIIGGVGYLPGALIGGFLLGLIQQLSIWQIDSKWQSGIVFAIVLLFLLIRPQGIFGNRLNVRRA
jgi:branched-chain amino acid transport system permease protein